MSESSKEQEFIFFSRPIRVRVRGAIVIVECFDNPKPNNFIVCIHDVGSIIVVFNGFPDMNSFLYYLYSNSILVSGKLFKFIHSSNLEGHGVFKTISSAVNDVNNSVFVAISFIFDSGITTMVRNRVIEGYHAIKKFRTNGVVVNKVGSINHIIAYLGEERVYS